MLFPPRGGRELDGGESGALPVFLYDSMFSGGCRTPILRLAPAGAFSGQGGGDPGREGGVGKFLLAFSPCFRNNGGGGETPPRMGEVPPELSEKRERA